MALEGVLSHAERQEEENQPNTVNGKTAAILCPQQRCPQYLRFTDMQNEDAEDLKKKFVQILLASTFFSVTLFDGLVTKYLS